MKHYWSNSYIRLLRNLSFIALGGLFSMQAHSGVINDFENPENTGYPWNDSDVWELTVADDPVKVGNRALKFIPKNKMNGGALAQGTWVTPLNLQEANNNYLSFWFYPRPKNGRANNLAIQIYDFGEHSDDATKVEIWTKREYKPRRWHRVVVMYENLPKTLDLSKIQKIQVMNYWPGKYYYDQLESLYWDGVQ